MFKLAIPVLHVINSAAAEEFYCNRLGFRREFAYRADETKPDPCYMGLVRDGAWLAGWSFCWWMTWMGCMKNCCERM